MADVVVVTHELSRTGAPLSLLHLLRWLRDHASLSIEVLAMQEGSDGDSLLDDYRDVVPTRIAPEVFSDEGAAGPTLPECRVVFVNSIFAAPALSRLPTSRPYVLSRIPELWMSFRHWVDPRARELLLTETDRFVAVSESVREMLVDDYRVDPEQIVVIGGSLDLAQVREVDAEAATALRRELAIPEEAAIVGAAGTTDWRKGPDLFVRLAKTVHERAGARLVHFLWLGGERGGPEFWRIERDYLAGSIRDLVHFAGSRPDPYPYYGLMDVFALTSREDPFPRVCLEVAAIGVPIVTFANGGAPELVAKGCGVVVGYLDVDAMADEVVALLDDPDRRRRLGDRGAEVTRREHTLDTDGPALLAEIETGLAREVQG